MRLNLNLLILFIVGLSACSKDELEKGHASASPSFSTLWDFTATFQDSNDDGLYLISMDHFNSTSGLIDNIVIDNITLVEDSIKLVYESELPLSTDEEPTAYYFIMIDEDALGEHYVIDSSKIGDSYIFLDCISKNRISGRFRINFVLSERSLLPKFAPHIPDSFFVEDGIFNAKKL